MDDACRALLALAPGVLAQPGLLLRAARRAVDSLGQAAPDGVLCLLPPGVPAPADAEAHGRVRAMPADDFDGQPASGGLVLLFPDPAALAAAPSLGQAAALRLRSQLAGLTDSAAQAGPGRSLRVALWGAGHYGRIMAQGQDWCGNIRLAAVLDANPAARGTDCLGLPVRPVEDLDDLDVEAVAVGVAGSRASVRAMQARLAPQRYLEPFAELGRGPRHEAALEVLAKAGLAPGAGLLDLADWTGWLTPDGGFQDALRQAALEIWREGLAANLEGLANLAPQVRTATGDGLPGRMDAVLGGLNAALAQVAASHQSLSQGLGKWLDVLDWERRCLAGAGLDLRGLRVLDIGFGSTLLNALLLYCEGAEGVVSLDPGGRPEVCESWTSLAWPLFMRLFGGFTPQAERDRALARLPEVLLGVDMGGGRLRLDRARLDHRYCGLEALDAPEASFDVAFSNTVLEHVLPMREAAANLFRVLKPGGRAFHFVDYAPHCDACHFSVYAHDPARGTYVNPDGVALNLLRSPQYVELFRSVGFEVTHLPGTAVACGPEALAGAHPAFLAQGRDTLAERSAHFHLRKP